MEIKLEQSSSEANFAALRGPLWRERTPEAQLAYDADLARQMQEEYAARNLSSGEAIDQFRNGIDYDIADRMSVAGEDTSDLEESTSGKRTSRKPLRKPPQPGKGSAPTMPIVRGALEGCVWVYDHVLKSWAIVGMGVRVGPRVFHWNSEWSEGHWASMNDG